MKKFIRMLFCRHNYELTKEPCILHIHYGDDIPCKTVNYNIAFLKCSKCNRVKDEKVEIAK